MSVKKITNLPEDKSEQQQEEVKKVDYSGTTTTSNFYGSDNGYPVIPRIVAREVEHNLLVVTPKDSRKTYMNRQWYDFKKGEQIAVPKIIAQQLAASELIYEEID